MSQGRKLRFLMWILVGILGLNLIAACTVRTVQNLHSATSTAVLECRVVQHNLGETCIPTHPQRVVTLSLATLGNALALGVKPIGATNEFQQENYLASFRGQTTGIEIVGGSEPNLESILRLKPELIIGLDWSSQIYPILSQIAPTVMGELHYPEWRKYFHFVAEILGRQEAENAAWEHYYQRVGALKKALGDRYQNKKISVIYFDNNGIGSSAINSYAGSILKDAGLQRPASQNSEEPYGILHISLEELEKADGDVIFLGLFAQTSPQIIRQIQGNPLWRKLKAVQTNRVYAVDVASWYATHMMATDAVIDDLFKYLVNTP